MSIKLQLIASLEPIDVQLGELANLLENSESAFLKISHKSVELSFVQMIVHIQNLIDDEMSEDIKSLLQTFRDMALEFFIQYERSLLMEIKKQKSIQKQVESVIKKISIDTNLEEARIRLLKDEEAASVECTRLINTFPTLLQYAVDKLRDEWQRLNMLAIANQNLVQNAKLFRALSVVVDVAAYSVGIAAEKIAIVPGSSFALYFFSYLKNFAVLTVPIYSVKAPWAWSIFWHELAGYKVRKLRKAETIDSIREDLLRFHAAYRQLQTPSEQKALLDEITRRNTFGSGSLEALFRETEPELILSDFGSFEHQFGQMLANLPQGERFKTYELIRSQGWSVDWFEELFEDAWSVLAIGEDFIPFFRDILNRHTSVDDRHPPREIRLAVADELLRLTSLEFREVKEPNSVIESAAQQILKFISLLGAASYRTESNDIKQISTRIIRTKLPEIVSGRIGKSIDRWSKQLEEGGDILHTKMDAEDTILALSEEELTDFVSSLTAASESEAIQVEPSYQKLLDKKNYLELLGLSFYETDFGVSTVTDVFYRTTKFHDNANLSSEPMDVDGGFVKYQTSLGPKHTTLDSWNVAAAPDSKINP